MTATMSRNVPPLNVCTTIYGEVARRAERKLKTRLVRLPPHLWASMTDDEGAWLKNVCNVVVTRAEDIEFPEFIETMES